MCLIRQPKLIANYTIYTPGPKVALPIDITMKTLALIIVSLTLVLESYADVGSLITLNVFNQMLKYRNDGRCPSNGFYKYDAFISAARSFNGFGTTGDVATQKKELAAFLGQTSHETTG